MKGSVILLFIFYSFADCFNKDLQDYAEYIENFNKQNYSWKARVYDREFTYGAILDEDQYSELETITHEGYNFSALPESFDARDKWSNCPSVMSILNQGGCGSCWAFAAATVASDRTCIHASVDIQLSEQDLQCCEDCWGGATVCKGGDPYPALNFWISHGLVSENCKPYNILELNNAQCKEVCKTSGIDYNTDKHYGSSVFNVSENEDTIKAELYENGPIVASFLVFDDLSSYSKGVYQVHENAHFIKEGHSVRVIGYGTENSLPYWLVANSWGPNWGEKGLFKVKRFDPKLQFEKSMVTGLPKK